MRHPEKWWIGLPVLAGLVFFASNALNGAVEPDLAKRLDARLASSPAIDRARVSVQGRDAVVTGVALSKDEKTKALAAAAREPGLRALKDATSAVGAAMPFVLKLERKGAVVSLSGDMPTGGARDALRAAIRLDGLDAADQTAYALGAPANFLDLARYAAARLAELDPGTATLTDASIVLAGQARSDADYDKALAALKAPPPGGDIASADIAPPPAAPFVFGAVKSGGMISLSGHIPSNDLRAALKEKAVAANPGFAVADAARAASGAPEGDFAAAAGFALAELGKLEQGKATLTGTRLAFEGKGRENVDAAEIEADAKANLPQGFELARADVEPGPISPYVFTAQRGEAALTLSGHLPDQAARDAVVEAARRLFPGLAVNDGLRVAKGAPNQFAQAANASLGALARLSDGKATLSGQELWLDGAALYERAIPDVTQQIAAALPSGFKVTARLAAKSLGGALEPKKSQEAIDAILSKSRLVFAADDALSPESGPVFDALAGVALRCRDANIEVGAHTDAFGIAELNRSVANRRARAVVDRLVKAGVDPARLTAVGHGGDRPIAPNDSDENRARNRRIEFTVK